MSLNEKLYSDPPGTVDYVRPVLSDLCVLEEKLNGRRTALLKKPDFNPELLSSLFDDAAIDHQVEPDGEIYVFDLAFNFWIKIDPQQPLLVFRTHWDFRSEVAELAVLRCVNALNQKFMMVQFSVDEDLHRLFGHYVVPLRDGLHSKQIMRSARMFARIFDEAAREGADDQLLEPWPLNEAESDSAEVNPKLLN